MKTIWKYPLVIDDEQVIQAPCGAQLLSIQVQNDVVCLWCLVESLNPPSPLKIILKGTGHPCNNTTTGYSYIDTFQLDGGKWVFHAFKGN